MSYTAGGSTIYQDYGQASQPGKQDTKEVMDQMVGLLVDFSDSFTKSQKILNSPEHQNLQVQKRIGSKLRDWTNEIKNTTLNQRRALNRLMSDVKYIVGSIPQSEKLYEDLEGSTKSLRDHWDSNRVGNDRNKVRNQMQDIMRILDMPMGPTPTTTTTSQVVRPSSSNSPQPVQSSQPVQRVYIIDPVTGQRVEKTDEWKGGSKPSPLATTQNSPRMSQTVTRTPSTPTTTRVIQRTDNTPQRNPEPTVVRREPSPTTTTTRVIEARDVSPDQRPSQTTTRVIRQEPQTYQKPAPTTTTTRVIEARDVSPDQRPSQTTTRVIRQEPQTYQQPAPTQTRYVQQPPQRTAPEQPPPNVILTKDYDYLSRRQDNEDRANNQDSLNKAGNMFESVREVRPEVDDNPTKIVTSSDGCRIFYGGDTFGVIEYDKNGHLVPRGRIFNNKVSDITAIHSTADNSPFRESNKSGDVLIGEFKNWNVHLYDNEMQELGRLTSRNGTNNQLPQTWKQFKTTSTKSNSALWYSGNSNISIVDTENYIAQEINGFWLMRGKSVDPIAAHLSKRGDVVGIGKYGSENSLHYFNINQPQSALAFERQDIFPHCRTWLCMDGGHNGDTFFIGGSGSLDEKSTSAFLIALTMNDQAEVTRYKEYPSSTGYNAVTTLKSYPDNVVICGTHVNMIIMLWQHNSFLSVRQVPLQIPLADLDMAPTNPYVKGPVVYGLHKNGTCTAFDFTKPSQGGPGVRVMPTKRNNKVYEMGDYMSNPQNTLPLDIDPSQANGVTPEQRRMLKKKPPQYANQYRDYGVRQIVIPEGRLGQVQALESERSIYTGGDNLSTVELKGGEYILTTKPNSAKPFFGLDIIPQNNEIIFREKSSGDLVKLDNQLNELRRLKGGYPFDQNFPFATTVHAGSDRMYLWPKSDLSLAIVDPNTFNQEAIPGFFCKDNERSSPICAIANSRADKIVGLYFAEGAQQVVLVDKSQGLLRKKLSEVSQATPAVYCLETSWSDSGIFFAGGSNTQDPLKGKALLSAITFDSYLASVDDLELRSPNGIGGVTSLTRSNDRDVLFAAAGRDVFVVEWTGTNFCLLNIVEDVHTGSPISQCAPGPLRLFTSSPQDSYVARTDFRS